MNGDDGAMHWTRPPGLTRRLRNNIALLFVRADWISGVASAIRRGDRPELRFALSGSEYWLLLGSAIFDTVWLAAWLLVAIQFHSSMAIFLASFPVLKWLLLLVAKQPAASARVEQSSKNFTTIAEPSSVFGETSEEPASVFEQATRHGAA